MAKLKDMAKLVEYRKQDLGSIHLSRVLCIPILEYRKIPKLIPDTVLNSK